MERPPTDALRCTFFPLFFFYRKIVLLGDIKSKPINPAGVTYGGLKGAYQAIWAGDLGPLLCIA